MQACRFSVLIFSFLQEISSAPNGDMIADVLIRALPTDSDLDQSAFIAEFSTLSGDSLWQRSGLQIQRMEVSSKKQKIPTWGVATMAAVIPFVIAFARKQKKILYQKKV